MDTMDLIARRLAARKNYAVITVYADGKTRSHETETLAQARNFATGEQRKVGRELIDPATGHKVTVVSVKIEGI